MPLLGTGELRRGQAAVDHRAVSQAQQLFLAGSRRLSHLTKPLHSPPIGIVAKKGEWANYQVAFVPDAHDNVVGVAYTLWTGEEVWAARRKAMSQGCTMVVYGVNVSAPHG